MRWPDIIQTVNILVLFPVNLISLFCSVLFVCLLDWFGVLLVCLFWCWLVGIDWGFCLFVWGFLAFGCCCFKLFCTSLCSSQPTQTGMEKSHDRTHCLCVIISFLLTQSVHRSFSNTRMLLKLNSQPFGSCCLVSLLSFHSVCLLGVTLKPAFSGISF